MADKRHAAISHESQGKAEATIYEYQCAGIMHNNKRMKNKKKTSGKAQAEREMVKNTHTHIQYSPRLRETKPIFMHTFGNPRESESENHQEQRRDGERERDREEERVSNVIAIVRCLRRIRRVFISIVAG